MTTEIERRNNLGEIAREVRATAGEAAAEQARAIVQARHVVALQRPRDADAARVRLLRDCARPGFAAVARWKKPIGRTTIEGPSIRFVEAALRAWGNVATDAPLLHDDGERQIVRVSVTDLEANLTYSSDVVAEKHVERRELRPGQEPIAVRTGASGQTVYVVHATEDELANKRGALVSKAIRTCGLRLLPADLVEEAMSRVVATLAEHDAKDPDAARKAVCDAFASVGVSPAELRGYLGHDLGASTPAELADLRAIYAALRDGEGTWRAIMDARAGSATEAPAENGRVARARAHVARQLGKTENR